MNKGLTVASVLLAFGLASATGAFAAGPSPKPNQGDPFKDGRKKMNQALCHNPTTDVGYTFLEAARLAKFDLVKCLIEQRNADLTKIADEDNINGFMWALVKQDGEDANVTAERDAIFDYLIAKAPALIKSKDKYGSGVLAYMAMHQYTSRLEKALKLGADMNEKDSMGVSAYGEAKSFGNEDVVAIFDKYAKKHNITIDKTGIPTFPEKTRPDVMPDGTIPPGPDGETPDVAPQVPPNGPFAPQPERAPDQPRFNM